MNITNDTPIAHICYNLTRFEATRADLRDGVTVITFANLIDEEAIAADYAEFGAWHAFIIHPRLNHFQGYSCVKYTRRIAHWTDKHITYDPDTKLYTGWDESGSDTVMQHEDRDTVVKAMDHYAKTLG